jgi:lysyl-tRNA synthetase class 2
MQNQVAWEPTASREALELRARLLDRIRRFFTAAGVLEVDTPVLSGASASDPSLRSFHTGWHGPGRVSDPRLYLHTSPESAMKRLLAAGSGSIYQICKVFRDGESGRRHNPEFTLLEWYRIGFDHHALMREVEALLRDILEGIAPLESVNHRTYRELFREVAGIDPVSATLSELREGLRTRGIAAPVGLPEHDRDGWLDVVMTHVIEPALEPGLVFIRDYPASQAALARLLPGEPPLAARFEAYLNGVELANGYLELTDASEQRVRFEQDNRRRVQQGGKPVVMDRRLLAALEAGLPDCAGVALGVDRLLMVAGGYSSLDDVIAFPVSRA